MLDRAEINIGICPIGWTNDDLPELGGDIPFEKCIKEIAEAGYEGTEVGGKFPKDARVLAEKLRPYNLRIAAQWCSVFFAEGKFDLSVNNFRSTMNFLKQLGAKVVVISDQSYSIQGKMDLPLFDAKPSLDEKGWERLVEGLHEIGKIAEDNGMHIAYHHHMGTTIQTYGEVKKLMESTEPSLVHLLVDTGHIYMSDGNESYLKLLDNFGDRIVHIHLKDVRESVKETVKVRHLSFLEGVKEGMFTVPGDGVIDYKPVIEKISEIGYSGWIMVEAEQDPRKADPYEYAVKAREYLRNLIGF